jgi:hypothetical protein
MILKNEDKKKSKGQGLLEVTALIVVATAVIYLSGSSQQTQAANNNEKIADQRVVDQIKKFQMAGQGGNVMEICARAEIIAAAFLQANDELNYKHWKEVERVDCQVANMSY